MQTRTIIVAVVAAMLLAAGEGMAGELSHTTSQLSQVELGKNAASVWALARISNALGLQLSSLLAGL